MWMFSEQTIIGLDIGSDSIKMTEVKNSNQGKELLTYGTAKHDLVLNGYWDSTKLRQLARIIEDIMESGDFDGVKTVMSVASKDVYVTTMDFDSNLNRKEIQNEIERQAPYFLPYPPDEMRLSWSLIENDPRVGKYTGKQRAIINALPDFVIENSKNLLEHCSLDGVALENQTISQIRALLDPDTGNTVLVDVGANQTTFNIVVDGVLRSSSHIPIGSEKITQELAENLGIKNSTAEHLKKDLALVNLFELPKPVNDNLLALKTELKTFIELNKKVSQTPEKVVFTGGGVYMAGFMNFFNNLQIPVYLGNSGRKVKIPEDYIPYLNPILNQLSTAIGLSLREDV